MTDPNLTLEDKWNQLLKQYWGQEFTEQDAEELWEVLKNPAFVRASLIIMNNCDMLKNNLFKLNYGNPEQAAMASKLQGEVLGALDVFNKLVTYAKEKETK